VIPRFFVSPSDEEVERRRSDSSYSIYLSRWIGEEASMLLVCFFFIDIDHDMYLSRGEESEKKNFMIIDVYCLY